MRFILRNHQIFFSGDMGGSCSR